MRDLAFCLRFLLRLSWRTSRRRLAIGGVLLLLGYLASPLVSVMLRQIVDAVIAGHRSAAIAWSAAAAVALIAGLMLGHFAHLFYFELGEQNEEVLTREVLRIVNGSGGLARCEEPGFADEVDLVRQDIVKMRATVESALQLGCLLVQALATSAILALVQPWLLLLPLAALAPVVLGRRAEHILDGARLRAAATARTIRHLRDITSAPGSQKEIRLCGNAEYLIGLKEKLDRDFDAAMSRAERRHAALRSLGQGIFAAAYVASIIFVFRIVTRGQASIGDAVMVITLATQISRQMSSGFELLSATNAASLSFRRLVSMREEPAGPDGADQDCPDAMTSGITFDNLTYRYPGAARPAVREVSLHLPAGRSVAIVGTNGAGKSTLIKLLTGLYQPSAGRVLVDGVSLASLGAESWRDRCAALFQDFAQLHFTLQESVGVGRVADVESAPAVLAAIERARAGALLERLDDGVATVLGHGYDDGTDLSGGQWQSVGLARTLMRDEPLLLCLDEPGHALDALAEQRMCDAYQETAAEVAARVGGVTVFVTHRLSTVSMADLIVVLDDGAVAEAGSHQELMALKGQYAELFELQSRAYAPSAGQAAE
jgi:ATP-binding cassette subfamily B protein